MLRVQVHSSPWYRYFHFGFSRGSENVFPDHEFRLAFISEDNPVVVL